MLRSANFKVVCFFNFIFLFSGSYPLHLAAWNGHADVLELLLNRGPSRANVNEQVRVGLRILYSCIYLSHDDIIIIYYVIFRKKQTI